MGQMPLDDGLSSLAVSRFQKQLDVGQRRPEAVVGGSANFARSTILPAGALSSVGTANLAESTTFIRTNNPLSPWNLQDPTHQ